MTCTAIAADLVDLARGVGSAEIDAVREAQVHAHVRACPSCAARLEREAAISAALRGLARHTRRTAADVRTEAAVLAAFDRRWKTRWNGPPPRARWPVWTGSAAAAAVLAIAFVAWFTGGRADRPQSIGSGPVATIDPKRETPERDASIVSDVSAGPSTGETVPVRRKPNRVPRAVRPLEDTDFVTWPGAAGWPRVESGELMRVELPIGVLPSLGLAVPATAAGSVPADVLVGQDGFARAVRLAR